jgi:alkylation response protein AidB-like acyl-CoA dehydrogenase
VERGDLHYAIALSEEARLEHGQPISLDLAARFLALIAKESPREYDAWAVRPLSGWLAKSGAPTIEQAAGVAGLLANLPSQPSVIEELAGVNATALSMFMGHANISVTLDLYGHLLPGSEDQRLAYWMPTSLRRLSRSPGKWPCRANDCPSTSSERRRRRAQVPGGSRVIT